VPVGLPPEQVEAVAERLASLFRAPGEVDDLLPIDDPGGPTAPARAAYHPASRVPAVVERALREGRRARDENRELLAEHCPGVERRVVRVAAGEVETFLAGEGPPVLLLHPFNLGAGSYLHQLRGLAGRFRPMVFHHPGVGATTAAADLSLDGLAELFREVLGELGVEPPIHLVGASFGGLVAQAFALRYPRESASLTLVGSSYKAGNRAGPISPLARVVAEDFDHLLARADSPRLRRERARFTEILLRCESMDPQTGLRYLDAFEESPDLLDRLPGLEVPTLIVQGRHDSVIERETVRRLRRAIPEARYLEIADAGHFPCLTHGRELDHVLAAFAGERERTLGRRAPREVTVE
jgi:pimeloyl-ACP methyl ester carboxylesterase